MPTRLVFGIDIDDGGEYAACGQDLEYNATLSNAGTDIATGVDVLVALPDRLDAALAVWTCLDASSGSALEGIGGLVDSGVQIPAGGSVTCLIRVPVRDDAPGDDILINATAIADRAGPASDADLDVLIVFRDGFDTASASPMSPRHASRLRPDTVRPTPRESRIPCGFVP